MKTIASGLASALTLALVVPGPLAAHGGHAGDHAWLSGALQPLLAVDHLLAALFVVGVGAVAFAVAGRRSRARRALPSG